MFFECKDRMQRLKRNSFVSLLSTTEPEALFHEDAVISSKTLSMPDTFHLVLLNNIYCNSNDSATGSYMLVLKLPVLCTFSHVCSLLLALFDVGARVSGVIWLTRPSRPQVLLQ